MYSLFLGEVGALRSGHLKVDPKGPIYMSPPLWKEGLLRFGGCRETLGPHPSCRHLCDPDKVLSFEEKRAPLAAVSQQLEESHLLLAAEQKSKPN